MPPNSNDRFKRLFNIKVVHMIIEVHVAFLLAALAVLFGITYTLGMFLDRETKRIVEKRKLNTDPSEVGAIKA